MREITVQLDCWWEFSGREGRIGNVGEKGEWCPGVSEKRQSVGHGVCVWEELRLFTSTATRGRRRAHAQRRGRMGGKGDARSFYSHSLLVCFCVLSWEWGWGRNVRRLRRDEKVWTSPLGKGESKWTKLGKWRGLDRKQGQMRFSVTSSVWAGQPCCVFSISCIYWCRVGGELDIKSWTSPGYRFFSR